MTTLRLEGQSWWFKEEDRELDTRDVLLRFLAGEIDGAALCRNNEDPDWKSIKQRFRFLGPYAILRKLGEGAFGVVYLGVHRDGLKTKQGVSFVALKSPTEALLDRFINAAKKNEDPELSESQNKEALRSWARLQLGELFSKEASLTARFAQCPHVVNVLDHNISTPYLALEFCNEGSLADRIRKPYSWEDVLSWGIQLSKALVVAHSLNPKVVHRDLKPDNVLIHNSQLKLGDLGTSQLLQSTESLRSLRGGFTPSYGAPEAFDAKACPETDVWSLGVMLYEFVSGELPFKAESMASLMKSITVSEPKELKNGGRVTAPDQFVTLIYNCLKKEARERPSAQECLMWLTELEKQSSAATVPGYSGEQESGFGEEESPGLQRRDLVLATSIILLAVILTGVFVYLGQSSAVKSDIGAIDKAGQKEKALEKLSRAQLRRLLRELERWDAATPKAQDQAIQYISKLLGQTFQLDTVQDYECQGIKHRIARFKHRSTGLSFHLIPGGQFQMGSEQDLARPIHTVKIHRPFLISPTELSGLQWSKLKGKNWSTKAKNSELPIRSVSREEALEVLLKHGFRLPSESEWEYACRGGSTSQYFWGDTADHRYSWNSDNRRSNGAYRPIMPVLAHFREEAWNAFGLCDMAGNVWEYCQDHWMNNYETGPVDERPRFYGSEQERIDADKKLQKVRRGQGVMRGGSYYGPVTNGQSGFRNCDVQDEGKNSSFLVGLRLCASVPGFPVPRDR